MPRYDFKCPRGHEFEERAPVEKRTLPCPYCGETAERQMPAPRLRADGAYSYRDRRSA